MREFYFTFDEGVSKGLRSSYDTLRNEQVLVECHNAMVGETGLLPYEPFGPAVDFDEDSVEDTMVWPFPQLIGLTRYGILVIRDMVNIEDRVYSIGSDGSLSEIAVIDALTFGGLGDHVDFADFTTYAVGTNGRAMFYYDPTLAAWQVPITGTSTIPLVKTLCNFKGQAIGGNVVSDWHGCGRNDVVWSRIGEFNFLPDRYNTQGFMPMPWNGQVLRVMRLGDYVIVYGDEGIAALKPATQPITTFGLEELLSIGIPNKMAVAGDENSHVCVTRDGNIRRIGRDLSVERLGVGVSYPSITKLGYEEFMRQLVGRVVVSFDYDKRDFYISDGNKCYLLTPFGLSEVHQLVTSIAKVNGQLTAAYADTGDRELRVTTGTLDVGLRGQKTLQTMEVGVNSTSSVYTSVQWRVDTSQAFQNSRWVLVNPSGFSTNIVAGTEFRLRVKASEYVDTKLDYITVRYKMTDMRSVRGVYAPAPRGQRASETAT